MRLVLGLRYRINTNGFKTTIRIGKTRKGILFLANHPSESDPVILMSRLWYDFRPRPVVLEDFYDMSGIHWLMRLIGAIPMPNVKLGLNSYKRMRVQQGLDKIIDHLQQGKNVLLYPAGRLMQSGRENLMAASATHHILQRCPETTVVLIRSRGLIGSSFSWVSQQRRPDLWQTMKQTIKHLFYNLIFFSPRRHIRIDCELAEEDLTRFKDKMQLNRYLETWYNQEGEETPSWVPLSLWKRRDRVIQDRTKESKLDKKKIGSIPDHVRKTIYAKLAELSVMNKQTLKDKHRLSEDLGLDSLQIADLLSWLEESYVVSDVNATDLVRIADVLLSTTPTTIRRTQDDPDFPISQVPHAWKEKTRQEPFIPDIRQSIQMNFFRCAARMPATIALADDIRGVSSYRQARVAVLLLADCIHRFPEKRIGILLPASSGASLLVLATLLAAKVPVMINWTLGDRNLRHVLKITEVKRILSSKRFLDRLNNVNLELFKDHLLTLETLLKGKLGIKAKVLAWFRSQRRPETICRLFSESHSIDDPAVILFTSGSESCPKAVPLTHRNILSNIVGCFNALKPNAKDCLYGFLPPFHSFGFTGTMILPLVTGLKVAYYPNPTEHRNLVKGIRKWTPSILLGTPTFTAGICNATSKGTLDSLRFIVVGAEKAPDALFQKVESCSSARLLEGYGITECAPVLTLNDPDKPRIGVGYPVADVEICIVDPESFSELPINKRGLIVVHGSNVFSGYLGEASDDAFIELSNKRFYVTGDLGYLDTNGALTLLGRLKRFIKIGGEMISLPALEASIQTVHPDEGGGVNLAIVHREQEGERPLLVLFTTFETSIDKMNRILREAGWSNLVRIHHWIQLDPIPVLGSGKTDYPSLEKRIAAACKKEHPQNKCQF